MGQQCAFEAPRSSSSAREQSEDRMIRTKLSTSSLLSPMARKYFRDGINSSPTFNVESLCHYEYSRALCIPRKYLHPRFCEFESIFPTGKAIMSIQSCEETQVNQGKCLITAGSNSHIVYMNYETGHIFQRWKNEHTSAITTLTKPILAEGFFASGSRDRNIGLWSLNQGKRPLAMLKGHTLGVSGVAMQPSGSLLASSSLDGTINLWDLQTTKVISSSNSNMNNVTFLHWLPTMSLIVQGGEPSSMHLWDIRQEMNRPALALPKTLSTFPGQPLCASGTACRSSWHGGNSGEGGYTLWIGSDSVNNRGSSLFEWDLRIINHPLHILQGHRFAVNCICQLQQPGYLHNTILSGGLDEGIRLWSNSKGHESSSDVVAKDMMSLDTLSSEHPCEPFTNSLSLSSSYEIDKNTKDYESRSLSVNEGAITRIVDTYDGDILIGLFSGSIIVAEFSLATNSLTEEEKRKHEKFTVDSSKMRSITRSIKDETVYLLRKRYIGSY